MATFGETSSGSSGDIVTDNDISGTQYSLTEDALVHSLSAFCRIATLNTDNKALAKCAIYTSSNDFVAETRVREIIGNTNQWYEFFFINPVFLTQGTYWLVIFGATDADQITVSYTADASVVSCRATEVGWPTFPATLTPGTDTDDRYSIYATYTSPVSSAWLTA